MEFLLVLAAFSSCHSREGRNLVFNKLVPRLRGADAWNPSFEGMTS